MLRTTGLLLAALVVFVGTAMSGNPEVNGFVQAQYEDQVREHSRFLIRTARIGISGDLTDRVSAIVQFDVLAIVTSRDRAIHDLVDDHCVILRLAVARFHRR